MILGDDHSIAEPNIRACSAVHGPVGLVHFDTHTGVGSSDITALVATRMVHEALTGIAIRAAREAQATGSDKRAAPAPAA